MTHDPRSDQRPSTEPEAGGGSGHQDQSASPRSQVHRRWRRGQARQLSERTVRPGDRAISEVVTVLSEQLQDGLATGVGNAERLHAELLLDLLGLQFGRLLVHVRINQLADAAGHRVH